MGKRAENIAKKVSFLRKMLDLKHLLFAALTPEITKETKKLAWTELRDFSVAIGLVPKEKDFTYVRDATWPNLRHRTVSKVDNAGQTGSGGGSDAKLDEIDRLVLEILGRESPIFQGMGMKDSLGEDGNLFRPESEAGASIAEDSPQTEEVLPIDSPLQKELPKPRGPIKKRVVVRDPDVSRKMELLKKRKLELEVRKLELEVWEKENALNVGHTTLTSHLEQQGEGIVTTDFLVLEENDIVWNE